MTLPFNPEDVEYYEIIRSDRGIVGIAVNLKTGGQQILEGVALTEEVKRFVLSQPNRN